MTTAGPTPDWLVCLRATPSHDNPTRCSAAGSSTRWRITAAPAASQRVTDFAYGWADQLGHGTGPGGTLPVRHPPTSPARHICSAASAASTRASRSPPVRITTSPTPTSTPATRRASSADAVIQPPPRDERRGSSGGSTSPTAAGCSSSAAASPSAPAAGAEKRLGSFQLGLAGYCLRRVRGPASLYETALVGLSQLATVCGAISEGRHERGERIPAAAGKEVA